MKPNDSSPSVLSVVPVDIPDQVAPFLEEAARERGMTPEEFIRDVLRDERGMKRFVEELKAGKVS